ncbi:ribosome recycling factor [Anaerorhabdus sp.]|jgi:ribosome recycling factor|uniref:ribosome recycling factor n=1 Tax=Anaerorhabdus sp. TaxID=1872524 RepID=UPI002FC7D151
MAYLVLDVAKEKMDKVIAHFAESLTSIRTGRANTTMLDHVEVDYYGSPTPVNQIASISVVEGRTLVIKPYDSSSLKNIEKACNEADLGIAPQNDGTVIRLTVPTLTEETRKEMCKKVSKFAEEAKVQVRNVRRDANEAAKKDDTLTEDLEKDCLDKVQKATDEAIKKIDEVAAAKEKEVMTI